jgi:hypothetical protein
MGYEHPPGVSLALNFLSDYNAHYSPFPNKSA